MDHLPSADALVQVLDPLIRQRTGVDLAEMNATMLRTAVAQHMQDLGIEEFSAYGQLLHGAETRVDELSERLAVIESWFFRDVGPSTICDHETSVSRRLPWARRPRR